MKNNDYQQNERSATKWSEAEKLRQGLRILAVMIAEAHLKKSETKRRKNRPDEEILR